MDEMDAAQLGERLKTGDLVLFGSGAWLPSLLRRAMRCRWVHVGLVVRDLAGGAPLLWEVAPRDRTRHGGPIGRPRLMPLRRRVLDFPGAVSLRPLSHALSAAQCTALDALRTELAARGSGRSLLDLMGAADDGWIGAAPANLGALLPAELVAEAYQRIGLLEDARHGGWPASDYAPRDFATGGRARLQGGFGFGPEIALHGGGRAGGWTDLTAQPA